MTHDVIKWKHFPRYWPFVRGIHRSPMNSPHKDQWHWPLIFSLICAWTNGWVNNRDAGDLRRHGDLRRSLWRHCNGVFRILFCFGWPSWQLLIVRDCTITFKFACFNHSRGHALWFKTISLCKFVAAFVVAYCSIWYHKQVWAKMFGYLAFSVTALL